MNGKISTTIIRHALLTGITLLLLFLPMKAGMFFGSNGDWYSQHVSIAESLRQTMLETGSLVPQYIQLGGGSNIYDFSYYGLLRPDVLFSCLIPDVEMKYIIAGYAVLCVLASVNLCYTWLGKKLSGKFAFAGAVILASAACFFHAHHQIMFVNYIPFLLLGLMGVDRLIEKKKIALLTVSLFFIYIHSFYYAIACLAVLGFYAVHCFFAGESVKKCIAEKKRREVTALLVKQVGRFMLGAVVSIGMAMVLLLPTGLDILANEKDGGSFAGVSLQAVDLSFKGLLYSPYGCGMTLLNLYCLMLSVTRKRKRFLSVTLLLCMGLPAVSLVLNGFLYARAKILIPFLPLLVLVTADTLQELYQGKQKYFLIPLLLCAIPLCSSSWKPLILADGILLSLWLFFQRTGKIPQRIRGSLFWMVLLMPVLVSLGVNMGSSYLKPLASKMGIQAGVDYLRAEDDRQKHFDTEEIAKYAKDSRYRFDVLANNFVNSNLLAGGETGKTAMYSSVTNTGYAKFCYDVIHNPISTNNRVALVPDKNPCFTYFMGLKYLLVKEDDIPFGYRKIIRKGDYILAESERVLPVCYGTTELLAEQVYQKLEFPENLEALCSRAVISTRYDGIKPFLSHMNKEKPEEFFKENGQARLLHPSGERESYTIPLSSPLSGKVLVISFHVESARGEEVTIRINGVSNKLSGKKAPYPNENHDFVYVLSTGENMEELEIETSKGGYTVDNLAVYTMNQDDLYHSDVVVPETEQQAKRNGESVFRGKITMEEAGYFVSSYPYREGYRIKVDGMPVEAEKVNTAFVGFPLGEGGHRIEITYAAPGYRFSRIVSIICCALFILLAVSERKREDAQGKISYKVQEAF
ncbi:MAG: YfhO family protein [Bacteroidales bacterium]|nr:YfhO family protein [Clostridium sp.]MCM1203159.1 YfhO family protein [Bacteroidales bacterium]